MANIYNMADTWADSGTVFTAIKMNVQDDASDASSLLMDLQVGGASKITFTKEGVLECPDAGGSGKTNNIDLTTSQYGVNVTIRNNTAMNLSDLGVLRLQGLATALQFGFNDIKIARLDVNTLAQHNNTDPQIYRTYNSYTGVSNGEWVEFGFDTNNAVLRPQANGTGTTRVLHISGLPTSDPGTGILWNDAGTVKVGV